MHDVIPLLAKTDFPAVRRRRLNTLQLNLGYRCNQSCVHCHVNAGPHRTEEMSAQTIDQVLALAGSAKVSTLDLTGGAPELNPHFRSLVSRARAMGLRVIDRCNLTILFEPGQQSLAEFLAAQRVEITASLPCYLEENVDAQRGKGVFDTSMRALQHLNELGYGQPGSGLELNLVYNPQGPVLPPSQASLEVDYRRFLGERFAVRFNNLFTLANMPIQRFGSTLISKGTFAGYLALLKQSHRTENLESIMCRDLISIDWQGYVYDCDFNQMLGLPLRRVDKARSHISDLLGADLNGNPVVVRDHCYGCTAGQGSSCGGALAAG
ncbi:MAG TPA: arsenosugar biosynthesis radical SAM protein ArsS [Burkholderiaceae bacterium]|jgi:radical SAM/Cys-rich protein|nr:arsenosugar biosynthesis radical SAM protein ArsS [Burkholderiaceae bacterium]